MISNAIAPPKLASRTDGSVKGKIQQDAQATAASPDIATAPAALRLAAIGTLASLSQPHPGSSEDGRVQTVQADAFSITLM